MKGRRETVHHPTHYGGDNPTEHHRVVYAWGLDYYLGNATKYICRAGKKTGVDPIEDLRKAAWYLQAEIDLLMARKQDDDVRVRSVRPKQDQGRAGVLPVRRDLEVAPAAAARPRVLKGGAKAKRPRTRARG